MQDDDSSSAGLARVEEPAELPTGAADLGIFLLDDSTISARRHLRRFLAWIRAPRQAR